MCECVRREGGEEEREKGKRGEGKRGKTPGYILFRLLLYFERWYTCTMGW